MFKAANTYKIFLTTVFISISFCLSAQDVHYVIFSGKVLNEASESLSFTTIIIKDRNLGTIASRNGDFRIRVKENEEIIFSSVGYFSKRYYVPTYNSLTEYSENIILRQDTIMLETTEIYPWPATYEEFSRKFIEFDEPENIVDLQLPQIKVPLLTHPGHIGITIPGPISLLYNLFSRSAKRQRQYAALIEHDRIQRKLALRYNKEIIFRITGLSDDKEIHDFMQYCNFTDEFIFNSLEYEIYLAIRNCYLSYVQSN